MSQTRGQRRASSVTKKRETAIHVEILDAVIGVFYKKEGSPFIITY